MTIEIPAPPRLAAPAAAAGAVSGAAYDEAIELTRRLKLPHIRRAMAEVIPTAKAQRWDPAETVKVLLAEEAAGRATANLRTRRTRAAFPTGKTFHIWNETASSIPIPTQSTLRTLESVARRENLCVVGPSGTGKSHFTEALGPGARPADSHSSAPGHARSFPRPRHSAPRQRLRHSSPAPWRSPSPTDPADQGAAPAHDSRGHGCSGVAGASAWDGRDAGP